MLLFTSLVVWPSLAPVSYTHLDVYKRQLLLCSYSAVKVMIFSVCLMVDFLYTYVKHFLGISVPCFTHMHHTSTQFVLFPQFIINGYSLSYSEHFKFLFYPVKKIFYYFFLNLILCVQKRLIKFTFCCFSSVYIWTDKPTVLMLYPLLFM